MHRTAATTKIHPQMSTQSRLRHLGTEESKLRVPGVQASWEKGCAHAAWRDRAAGVPTGQ